MKKVNKQSKQNIWVGLIILLIGTGIILHSLNKILFYFLLLSTIIISILIFYIKFINKSGIGG